MKAKVLMFQGTGSDVGKSTLVTALCRVATRRGLSVAPFKPQNMSNNAAACADGGEIGRAQALQARACGLEPHTDFNPVLLKPQSDRDAQVVVHGQVYSTTSAADYMLNKRAHLLSAVLESYRRLEAKYDLILVEGAGSASEVNLRANDIANMGFARAVSCPVCLIGDIDRGGVIASIVGTQVVIDPEDAKLISSFLINRFRGDPALFEDGVTAIERATSWPCRGVVPWLPEALRLPQEDAVVLEASGLDKEKSSTKRIHVSVPMLSRIANFDDLDPLRAEPNVVVEFIPPGQVIPLHTDVIVIPGTKSTIGDLMFMRQQGWDHDILTLARNGVRVLGICGGYQLLGKTIADPNGIEGPSRTVEGIGLLNVNTIMSERKTVVQVSNVCSRSGLDVQGYEIHIGETVGKDTEKPFLSSDGVKDGAISENGLVEGTYMHGVLSSDSFRSWWIDSIRTGASSTVKYQPQVETDIDQLADSLEQSVDIDSLLADARVATG